jgi:hypothetical protein
MLLSLLTPGIQVLRLRFQVCLILTREIINLLLRSSIWELRNKGWHLNDAACSYPILATWGGVQVRSVKQWKFWERLNLSVSKSWNFKVTKLISCSTCRCRIYQTYDSFWQRGGMRYSGTRHTYGGISLGNTAFQCLRARINTVNWSLARSEILKCIDTTIACKEESGHRRHLGWEDQSLQCLAPRNIWSRSAYARSAARPGRWKCLGRRAGYRWFAHWKSFRTLCTGDLRRPSCFGTLHLCNKFGAPRATLRTCRTLRCKMRRLRNLGLLNILRILLCLCST